MSSHIYDLIPNNVLYKAHISAVNNELKHSLPWELQKAKNSIIDKLLGGSKSGGFYIGLNTKSQDIKEMIQQFGFVKCTQIQQDYYEMDKLYVDWKVDHIVMDPQN